MPYRKLHRLLSLAALILCCVSMVSAQAPAAKQPAKQKIKIGWSIFDMRLERWQIDCDAFQARAKSLGADVVVKDGQGDSAEWVRQTEEAVASGIQVLVVVGGDAAAEGKITAAAKAKGVRVITYEGGVTNATDLAIATDYDAIGRSQVSAITERAPTGTYVILNGPAGQSGSFHKAQLEALQPFVKDGRIKVVADLSNPDWSAGEAYLAMTRVLESNIKPITAVIATNDSIASGVIQALEERGLAGKVLLSGQDADISAVIRILKGTQTMTLYKPIAPQAQAAAEAAVSLARGEPVKTNGFRDDNSAHVPAIFFRPVVVTKENVKQTVIKDGHLTLEEIKLALPREEWSLIE